MQQKINLSKIVIVLSGAAFLSFLGRTFIDYNIVFPEMGITEADLVPVTPITMVFYGIWLWGLFVTVRGGRQELVVTLVYNLLLIILGLSTLFSFCPSPCGTAWPLSEVLIWSNLLIGVAATIAAVLQLRGQNRLQPTAL